MEDAPTVEQSLRDTLISLSSRLEQIRGRL